MTTREKMFFVIWCVITLPLLLLFLRLHFNLDAATIGIILTYIGGMHIYAAFDNWNKTP